MEATPDEIMVVCISRQIVDGEIVAQGLATPLVAAAFVLARLTHAPHLYFASAIGQSVCRHPAPLSITGVEKLWLDRSMNNVGFVRAVADLLPRLKPKEFFRPAQIDRFGNFNNIAFGKDYLLDAVKRPRLRLPGSGGIPDVTPILDGIYLYVPRHSRITFAPVLDVRSGLGNSPERRHGKGPVYLVSNLGQFDFANGRMRLATYHPGVTIQEICSHTGFELEISPDVCETPAPTPEEIHLLRSEIDPLGIRCLELLSGASRRELLREILEKETQPVSLNS